MTRPIFFLTDFGLADTYVGVVKAVILSIVPDAAIVDLTHDIPPQDIRAGALALLTALPYLPPDAVVLAVVDPGVGTERRPIAVQAGGRHFVGPDNGLLGWAVAAASGGETADGVLPSLALTPSAEVPHAVVLDRPDFWRPMVSATFHGRDLFGPVAAYLARGATLHQIGSPAETIQTLPFPHPERELDEQGRLRCLRGEVIQVDRFGNLVTSLAAEVLPDAPVVEIAGQTIVGLAPHFQAAAGDPAPIALIGSGGLLEVAAPNGSAAILLGAGIGAGVTVRASGRASGTISV